METHMSTLTSSPMAKPRERPILVFDRSDIVVILKHT
jgi:hypothetical protein